MCNSAIPLLLAAAIGLICGGTIVAIIAIALIAKESHNG